MTNILKLVLFLPFFFYKWIILVLNSKIWGISVIRWCNRVGPTDYSSSPLSTRSYESCFHFKVSFQGPSHCIPRVEHEASRIDTCHVAWIIRRTRRCCPRNPITASFYMEIKYCNIKNIIIITMMVKKNTCFFLFF